MFQAQSASDAPHVQSTCTVRGEMFTVHGLPRSLKMGAKLSPKTKVLRRSQNDSGNSTRKLRPTINLRNVPSAKLCPIHHGLRGIRQARSYPYQPPALQWASHFVLLIEE